ncbi:sirohydrochlorin cobaltochelatase [Lentisphaerota bacterium WC36G]|nr:sirohydrochlorin cobaltochelatase [Lentisphaerae bacterium WC36]
MNCLKNKTNCREAILLVAFGSTVNSSAHLAYDNIEKQITYAYPDAKIYWAYSSRFMLKHFAKKNIKKFDIEQALEQIIADDITKLTVQSVYFNIGKEHIKLCEKLQNLIEEKQYNLTEIKLGLPLLINDQDVGEFVANILADVPIQTDREEAIVFIMHGSVSGYGEKIFNKLQCQFKAINENYFMTSIEGQHRFDECVKNLALKKSLHKIYLVPLLIAAGFHAKKDIAGNEANSLLSMIHYENKELEIIPLLKGLGEYNDIAQMFIQRIKDANGFL